MQQPAIMKKTSRGADWSTPESELFAERTVAISGPINADTAVAAVAQLRYLDRNSSDPVTLLVNSPGGSVSDGMAIIDFMRGMRSPIRTHALGIAASMAAIILACGEPGFRSAAPHADILVHQPMSGISGQASDIEIAARSIIRKKEMLAGLLAEVTGRSLEVIEAATDRDTWLTPDEAKSFGVIDRVCADWNYEGSVR